MVMASKTRASREDGNQEQASVSQEEMVDAAIKYSEFGFNALPLLNPAKTKTKHPSIKWKYGDRDFSVSAFTPTDILAHAEQRDKFGDKHYQHGIIAVTGPGNLRNIDTDQVQDFTILSDILTYLGLPQDYPWVIISGSQKGLQIWVTNDEGDQALLDAGLPCGKSPTEAKSVYSTPALNQRQFDHIELRWRGNCAVLPPSEHPSGNRYSFYNGIFPTTPPMHVPVQRIVAMLHAVGKPFEKREQARQRAEEDGEPIFAAEEDEHPYAFGALRYICKELADRANGGRNNALFNGACTLFEFANAGHLNRDHVIYELFQACEKNGLPDPEVESTILSAERTVGNKKRDVPHRGGTAAPRIKITKECFDKNEFGDALLFASIYSGRAVYDTDEEKWYVFDKHVWNADHGKVRRLIAEGVCDAYQAVVISLYQQVNTIKGSLPYSDLSNEGKDEVDALMNQAKAFEKRIFSLRSVRRANSVLTYAGGNESFDGAQNIASMQVNAAWWQERDPYLLGFKNGILDFKLERYTGKLRAGQPEDRIRSVLPTPWEGEGAPHPALDQLLTGMFADRKPEQQQEMITFLQHMLGGLGLPAVVLLHVLLILVGKDGRNGKDTLLTHLSRTLGTSLAGPIEQSCILKRPAAAAGAASPHLAKLEGMLLAWVSEPDRGERMDGGQLKLLIGGGDVPVRKNYGDSRSFQPTHQLILSCNNKPHVDANDKAIWPKIFPIVLKMRYLAEEEEIKDETYDRPADTTLPSRLNKELAGGIAWLVAGSLAFQRDGLQVPAEVVAARNLYRGSEDTHQIFLDEECTRGVGRKYLVTLCYSDYREWCLDGGRKPMTDLRFKELMEEKGYLKKRYNVGMCWQGICPASTIGSAENTASTGGILTFHKKRV